MKGHLEMNEEQEHMQTAISVMVFDGWSDEEILAEAKRLIARTRAEMKAKLLGDFSGT